MTSLTIHSRYDYLTDTSVDWRPVDHRATKLVKAVKGMSFGGRLELTVNGKLQHFRHPNCEVVVDHIAERLAEKIAELTTAKICLVPVPNSHVVNKDEDYRCLAFAKSISSNLAGRSFAAGAFHWKAARKAQHLTKGRRHMSQFVSNLNLCRTPRFPVVLIDDMVTSGSQMLACKHILIKAGCEVLFGMSAGRLAEQQKDEPISWHSETYSQRLDG